MVSGVALTLRLDERDEETVTIGVGFLLPAPGPGGDRLDHQGRCDAAIGLAKVVSMIYPDRIRIAGLDEEINRLIRHSAEVFSRAA